MYRTRSKKNSFRIPLKTSPDDNLTDNSSSMEDQPATSDIQSPTSSVKPSTSDMGNMFTQAVVDEHSDSGGAHTYSQGSDVSEMEPHNEPHTESSSNDDIVMNQGDIFPPTINPSEHQAPTSFSWEASHLAAAIAPPSADLDTRGPQPKHRHLDVQECMDHANSASGSQSLTQPQCVVTSSRDPHRGLYPRTAGTRRALKHNKTVAGSFSPPRPSETLTLPESHQSRSPPVPGSLEGYEARSAEGEMMSVPLSRSSCDAPAVTVHGSATGFVAASALGLALPAVVQAKLGRTPDRANNVSPAEGAVGGPAGEQGQYSGWKGGQRWERKRKPISQQSNTLNSYFSKAPPPSHAVGSEGQGHKLHQGQGSRPAQGRNAGVVDDDDNDVILLGADLQPHATSQGSGYHKTEYKVNVPQLPSLTSPPLASQSSQPLLPSQPPSLPRPPAVRGCGTKRKSSTTRGRTRVKWVVKSVGPASHTLQKASFLYDKQLAKAPTAAATSTAKVKSTGDKYGLLGSGNYPRDETMGSYFDALPYEIIENIFCRLPMMDLYLNVNRVCHAWNDIIADNNFLPWKKRYHQVKAGRPNDVGIINSLLTENEMISHDSFLPQLIRHMKTFKKLSMSEMIPILQKHSKFDYAKALIDERFTDCINEQKMVNPWCMIAVLVLVSEYVTDICEIYRVLLAPSSCVTAYELIECFYCIATFLLTFTNKQQTGPWNGLHYRLYYALYLLENESTTTCDQLTEAASHGRGGQQSLIRYTSGSTVVQMTHEQLRICNHKVQNGDVIKIVAFAGTGKTTTLLKYTQLRPNLKFLLVVYNRSVQRQAAAKFPVNVTCKTGHMLAYAKVGFRYGKQGKLAGDIKVTNILNHFTATKGETLYVQAKFIITTLKNFMASADEFITTAHVPEYSQDDNGLRKQISHEHRMHYSEQASQVWEKMINLTNDVKITHDTYMKLYQLQHPKIWGYDVILIDEAQDMTPALADVMLQQRQAKILVGDPHQQIYGFRGAVNAMQQVPESQTFYLTQSFRFGAQIAFVASSCLSILKGERRKTLVGNCTTGSIRGGVEGQLAIITRTNFTLFNEAVKKCCYSDTGETVAFVGGIDGFGFDMILDIYALMSNDQDRLREIKNKFIRGFQTLAELEKYAKKTSDAELSGKIRIVKVHHNALPSLISKIRARAINDTDIADVVLSTAHKAKGLEFSSVKLTDDFMIDFGVIIGQGRAPDNIADECNLLYVAATRAKKRLILTPTLKLLLKVAGENFCYPELTARLKKAAATFECEVTGATFDPMALTLVKRHVCMEEKLEEPVPGDALYSPETVHRDMAAVRYLYGRPGEEDDDPVDHGPEDEDAFVINDVEELGLLGLL